MTNNDPHGGICPNIIDGCECDSCIQNRGWNGRLAEAHILDQAARILQRDSRRPRSILLAAFCKALRDHANKLRTGP